MFRLFCVTEATGVTRLASTAIRIVTGEGTLVVEVDDPNVSVTIDGEDLVITGAGPKEVRLRPGSYRVRATKDGHPVATELVTITRNGKRVVKVGVEPSAAAADFQREFQLVVRAGRDRLNQDERNRLLAQGHPLLMQLADPPTKRLIELFAGLPDQSHQELLERGYLKWAYAELDEPRRQVYRDSIRLNLDLARKQGVEPPATMSLEALTKGEVGFAVVDIPDLRQRVVSWFVLFPDHPAPVWVTVVGVQAAGKEPYFAAHQQQLSALRTKPASRPPGADGQGFVPLFNGRDLTGWTTHPEQPGGWEVKDGVLVGRGQKSHLFSERADFGDFHLRVVARVNDGGNSGVYFRVPKFALPRLGRYPDGYEAQINSTHPKDPNRTGSLWRTLDRDVGIVPARQPPPRPGEWFTLEVIAAQATVTIKVNGETTAEYLEAKNEYLKGHLVLQVLEAETVVEFRTIEIKELPPAKPD